MTTRLLLVKLGGSLVTDKTRPLTAKVKIIEQQAREIAKLKSKNSDLDIVVGNGAGSFGHYTVKKYVLGTAGRLTGNEKKVREVHQSVGRLNGLVVAALRAQGLDVRSLTGQQVVDDAPLPRGVILSVYGDIISKKDQYQVISTEELFLRLLPRLYDQYRKIDVVFMTSVGGVLGTTGNIIPVLSRKNDGTVFYEAVGFDVTGGMKQKVEAAVKMKQWADNVYIIGGKKYGNLLKSSEGKVLGTKVV